MSDLYLLLTPALVFAVLALAGNVGCAWAVNLPAYRNDAPLVVDETFVTRRNDFTGWVGMVLVPHPDQQNIYAIGRFCLEGNNQSHDLKLVDAATLMDVPDTTVTVNLAGHAPNTFAYAKFPRSPLLDANSKYYVLSSETAGGDEFWDFDTTVTLADAAPFLVPSAAFGYPTADPPITYSEKGGANQAYGPVDIQYGVKA